MSWKGTNIWMEYFAQCCLEKDNVATIEKDRETRKKGSCSKIRNCRGKLWFLTVGRNIRGGRLPVHPFYEYILFTWSLIISMFKIKISDGVAMSSLARANAIKLNKHITVIRNKYGWKNSQIKTVLGKENWRANKGNE